MHPPHVQDELPCGSLLQALSAPTHMEVQQQQQQQQSPWWQSLPLSAALMLDSPYP